MISTKSPIHDHLLESLAEAEVTGKDENWKKQLNNPLVDGFLGVLDYGFPGSLFSSVPFATLDEWLLGLDRWREHVLDPTSPEAEDVGSLVLFDLWEHFCGIITEQLKSARLVAGIPLEGGLLVFVAGLSKCIVLR